ncbi:MAG TPA: hypothetical protein PKD49_00735 [Hyphomicrobium sp.]|nr:hypothetical protein [Hyphomicrobium sp.]
MVRLSARALFSAISWFGASAIVLPAQQAAWVQDAQASKAQDAQASKAQDAQASKAQDAQASKSAQDGAAAAAGQKKVSKKSKPAPKYEEHYELLPADDSDSSGDAAVSGSGLDPEGDPIDPANARSASAPPAQAARQPFQGGAQIPASAAKDAADLSARNEREKRDGGGTPSMAARPSAPGAAASAASDSGLGEDVADLGYFRHALDTGGEWRTNARYGDVFVPEAPEDWRPYTLGHWVYSDAYGWTWVSDEPFGWATYHYGRWTQEDGQGWMWIPGGEWGPSWVVWRQTDDAIGWAALPPSAKFTGARLALDADAIDNASFVKSWVFIRPRYFARAQMSRYLRPARWNQDLVDRSQARLGYERDAETGHILNRGIPPDEVEKLAGEAVARTIVTPAGDPQLIASKGAAAPKGEIKIFRPARKHVEQAVKASAARTKRSSAEGAAGAGARSSQAAQSDPPRSGSPRPASLANQATTGQKSEAHTSEASPKAETSEVENGAPAANATSTGSLSPAASKRHWDSSGPSGAAGPAGAASAPDQP